MSYIVSGSVMTELSDILDRELSSLKFRDQPVAIHAGHYFLELGKDGMAKHRLARFSRETWEAACKIAADHRQVSLLTLVNDWQFLPQEPSRRQQEQRAAHLRRMYYIETPLIPEFHLDVLLSLNVNFNQFLQFSREQWLFSESSLRTKFAATLKSVMKDPARAEELGLSTRLNESNEPIISVQTDSQACTLLHCGNAGCAGEVVELLKELYERGVRNFINIYPGQCHLPVESGTEISRQLFGLEGMEVVNIAIR